MVVGLLETGLREGEESGAGLLEGKTEETARAVETEKRRQIAVLVVGNGLEELEIVFEKEGTSERFGEEEGAFEPEFGGRRGGGGDAGRGRDGAMVGEEGKGFFEGLLGGAEGAEREVAFGLFAQVASAGEVADAGVVGVLGVMGSIIMSSMGIMVGIIMSIMGIMVGIIMIVIMSIIIMSITMIAIMSIIMSIMGIMSIIMGIIIMSIIIMSIIIMSIIIMSIIITILHSLPTVITLILQRLFTRLLLNTTILITLIIITLIPFTSLLSPSLTSHRLHHRQQLLVRRHRLPQLPPSRQRRRKGSIQRQRQRVRQRLLRHLLTTP